MGIQPDFRSIVRRCWPVRILQGPDPPDFCVTASNAKIAIEVTTFTSPQFEVFSRERSGPGPFTSTLRTRRPDREFWRKLRGGTLPDDSTAIPHVEAISDLDADYASAAAEVLKQKVSDLVGYGAGYSKCILLVHDSLSTFRSDWERRQPVLRHILACLANKAAFDDVILVDGNHYPSDTALEV